MNRQIPELGTILIKWSHIKSGIWGAVRSADYLVAAAMNTPRCPMGACGKTWGYEAVVPFGTLDLLCEWVLNRNNDFMDKKT